MDKDTSILIEAMKNAPVGVALWDVDGRLVMCNDAYRKLHQNFAEILVPGLEITELLRIVEEKGLRRVVGGKAADWGDEELVLSQYKAGSDLVIQYGDKWVQVHRKKLPDGTVIAFHTDITEIKVSEERFRRIFQSSPALVSISTIETAIILDVNEAWLETLGHKKEDVIGQTPFELNLLIDPNIRSLAARRVDRDQHINIETQFRTKNGEIRNFLVSGERIEFKGQDCYLFPKT